MAQKLFSTERKVKGERERELSFGIKINVRGGGGGGSELGKGRVQVPNIFGDEWKNRSTLGKNPLVGRRQNPINVEKSPFITVHLVTDSFVKSVFH